MGTHTVLKPAVPYWNWMALGFGWRSDNRRSSCIFRGIARAGRGEDLEGEESNAKSRVGVSEGKWLKGSKRGFGPSANQVSGFVIVPRNDPIEFDWLWPCTAVRNRSARGMPEALAQLPHLNYHGSSEIGCPKSLGKSRQEGCLIRWLVFVQQFQVGRIWGPLSTSGERFQDRQALQGGW